MSQIWENPGSSRPVTRRASAAQPESTASSGLATTRHHHGRLPVSGATLPPGGAGNCWGILKDNTIPPAAVSRQLCLFFLPLGGGAGRDLALAMVQGSEGALCVHCVLGVATSALENGDSWGQRLSLWRHSVLRLL